MVPAPDMIRDRRPSFGSCSEISRNLRYLRLTLGPLVPASRDRAPIGRRSHAVLHRDRILFLSLWVYQVQHCLCLGLLRDFWQLFYLLRSLGTL